MSTFTPSTNDSADIPHHPLPPMFKIMRLVLKAPSAQRRTADLGRCRDSRIGQSLARDRWNRRSPPHTAGPPSSYFKCLRMMTAGIQPSPLSGSVCTRRVNDGVAPCLHRAWVLLHGLRATSQSLSATSNFDRRYESPVTERARWCPLVAERRHRGRESREGDLEHHASQGRFWLRQHPSDDDQGTCVPPLRRYPLGSRVIRIPWSTKSTTWSSGLPVRMYVERLNEG